MPQTVIDVGAYPIYASIEIRQWGVALYCASSYLTILIWALSSSAAAILAQKGKGKKRIVFQLIGGVGISNNRVSLANPR